MGHLPPSLGRLVGLGSCIALLPASFLDGCREDRLAAFRVLEAPSQLDGLCPSSLFSSLKSRLFLAIGLLLRLDSSFRSFHRLAALREFDELNVQNPELISQGSERYTLLANLLLQTLDFRLQLQLLVLKFASLLCELLDPSTRVAGALFSQQPLPLALSQPVTNRHQFPGSVGAFALQVGQAST